MKSYLLLMKAGKKNMDSQEVVKYGEGSGVEYIVDVNIKRPSQFLNVSFLICSFWL